MKTTEVAMMLNGRPYGEELSKEEEKTIKELGYIVVFGYSDDNMETRGVDSDEYGCFEGSVFHVTKKGMFIDADAAMDFDFGYSNFGDRAEKIIDEKIKEMKKIEAQWDNDGYSWTYKTNIPHETFNVYEDGDKYCRGIVFDIKDL